MSKITQCADLIHGICYYSDKNEVIRTESKFNSVIESMLIFLDEEDLIHILNIVFDRLATRKYTHFNEYIERKIKFLRECID
jgi:hypothetical protein